MTLTEFKALWVEAGKDLNNLVLNHYKMYEDEQGYINGFAAVLEGEEYDFYGQMSLFMDATEGWFKFVKDESECGGYFEVDEAKKAEIIAQREAEAKKPTAQDQLEAQIAWTALLTDTLLPEEEA